MEILALECNDDQLKMTTGIFFFKVMYCHNIRHIYVIIFQYLF